MSELSFTVIGRPATKGSTRSHVAKRRDGSFVLRESGNPLVVTHDDAGEHGRAWRESVAGCALEARVAQGHPLRRSEPMGLAAVFYTPRGKGHFGEGRNCNVLKADAPTHPAKRPDADKLLRAVFDALTGVLWADDGQVVVVSAEKRYGDPARAEIRTWVVTPVAEDHQTQLPLLAA